MDRFRPARKEEERRAIRRRGWDDGEVVFLTVGRIEAAKDHPLLVKALSQLLDTPGWRSCWISRGSGNHTGMVESQVAASALADRIDIRPPLEEIEMAYKACDVVVLPSVREGTPNVLLEAMACGRPVVATDAVDVSRYVEDQVSGWLVPRGNAGSRAHSLAAALGSTEEARLLMGENAREKLRTLGMNVKTMVHRHESLYEELLAGGAGGE